MFSSVLVANRGEIALRVIRTCRRLGIRTVAVYSDPDARSPHVRAADDARRIGPGPAAESYLRGDVLLEAARATGAEAVHPGYGFLAENGDFAEACEAAGVAWVGPPAAAMRLLGDKGRAKALAVSAGVPVLEGCEVDASDGAGAGPAARAREIGYPLLVKARAGGGGRGMRVVDAPEGLVAALAAAGREAEAAFGDGRLLLERYLRRPRHVEVQVLGDRHGTLVHLGERECSIQRRHQKLIEESPSPAVTPAVREALGDAALRLARAAGYSNAGTVEFLLDESGSFHLLEVNTRLQVEHPVTEAVTGLDLVELQLRVAAGEPLGFGQDGVRLDGHAMELRVVAEDVVGGFLPAAGVVTRFDPPAGVRTDAGVETGTAVPAFYDSLLLKLIAHGRDRGAAIEALQGALDALRLDGVPTDVDLLASVLEEPAFRAGDLSTGFLEEHAIVARLASVPDEAVAAAAFAASLVPPSSASSEPSPAGATDPWLSRASWRVGRVGEPTRWATAAGARGASSTVADRASGKVVVTGDPALARDAAPRATVGVRLLERGVNDAMVLEVDGRPVSVSFAPPPGDRVTVRSEGWTHRVRPAPPLAPDTVPRHVPEEAGTVAAPMPGRIVRVAVAEGEHVDGNATLVVLEAMKMEHAISSPGRAHVARLHVAVGDQVARGAPLVELDAAEHPGPPE